MYPAFRCGPMTAGPDGYRRSGSQHRGALLCAKTVRSIPIQVLTILPSLPFCSLLRPGRPFRPGWNWRCRFNGGRDVSLSGREPFLRPGHDFEERRAQELSRLAAGHRRRRLGLDGFEHGATIGLPGGSCRLPCACGPAPGFARG